MAGELNISAAAGDFQEESKIKQILNNPAKIFLSLLFNVENLSVIAESFELEVY